MAEITDRELLERAAKAAGYPVEDACQHRGLWAYLAPGYVRWWNPLTDDGDALRLAAKLHIDLDWQATHAFPEPMVEAYRRNADVPGHYCASEPETDYRRAIVRAASYDGCRAWVSLPRLGERSAEGIWHYRSRSRAGQPDGAE